MFTPPPSSQANEAQPAWSPASLGYPEGHQGDQVNQKPSYQMLSYTHDQQVSIAFISAYNTNEDERSLPLMQFNLRPQADAFEPHPVYHAPSQTGPPNQSYGLQESLEAFHSPAPAYSHAAVSFRQDPYPYYHGPDSSKVTSSSTFEYQHDSVDRNSFYRRSGFRPSNVGNTSFYSAGASTESGSSPCAGPATSEHGIAILPYEGVERMQSAPDHLRPFYDYNQSLRQEAGFDTRAYDDHTSTHPAFAKDDFESYSTPMSASGFNYIPLRTHGNYSPYFPTSFPDTGPTSSGPMDYSFGNQSSYDLSTTSLTPRREKGDKNKQEPYLQIDTSVSMRASLPIDAPLPSSSPLPVDLAPSIESEPHSAAVVKHLHHISSERSQQEISAPAPFQTSGANRVSCFCGRADDFRMVECNDPDHSERSGIDWMHADCARVSKADQIAMKQGGRYWICNTCTPNIASIAMQPVLPSKEPRTIRSKSAQSQRRSSSMGHQRSDKKGAMQRGSWTEEEQAVAIALMRDLRTNHHNGTLEDLWYAISIKMKQEGLNRTPAAVKNQWNRSLRAKSGFDERAKAKPDKMRTGVLEYKSKSRGTKSLSITITPGNGSAIRKSNRPRRARRAKSEEMVEEDSNETLSASGSDSIFPGDKNPFTHAMTASHIPNDQAWLEDSDESYEDETIPDAEGDA